jgi:hypothetical protein
MKPVFSWPILSLPLDGPATERRRAARESKRSGATTSIGDGTTPEAPQNCLKTALKAAEIQPESPTSC